ncbi:hypothetical protein Y032_0345g3127 [Ancylostoma ceylanicum]|uniref:Uncharacterized protein n=1 Tax=Ancylostoma ceylanicum TaxID=53326 RepID=A0A016RXP2_9BILA|nr:hypothetical protein Y032_0345g3127 [Ancylostoma ceylanicum]
MSFLQSAFGISYNIRDVAYALLLSIIILPFTSLLPLMKSKMLSYDELREVELIKSRDKDTKLPSYWPFALREILQLLLTWLTIGFFILDVSLACSLAEDASIAFTRRYVITLFFWIAITEPLKGMLCAYIILKKNPSHFISCEFDEAILPLDYVDNCKPAPECLRNDVVGTTESDLKQLQDNKDKKTREELFFETMREVACLLASLVVIMGLVFYYRDNTGFLYQQQVRSLLNLEQIPYGPVAFGSINQIEQFWTWANDSLAPALLASWYDGGPAWAMRGFANDKVSRAMGIGHIRQIRSVPLSQCYTVPQLAAYSGNCTRDITFGNEDRHPQYARGWKPYVEVDGVDPPAEYKYRTADEHQNAAVEGRLHSYGGGGYSVLLKGTPLQIQDTLKRLKQEHWIDKNTRVILVELSMYNAQVNYFAVVELVIEIPAEGYLLPSSWVEAVRLIKYQGRDGDIIMTFEFLYIAFAIFSFLKNTFYYGTNVVNAFKTLPPKGGPIRNFLYILLGRFWDFVDFFVGILAICSVIAFFLRQQYIEQALENFAANNGNAYINLSQQRNMELMFTFCVAGVVFFVSCKLIKILRFNRRIAFLADTLDYAGVSITDFAVVFVLIICAFNASLYCLLWNKLESYKSAVATFETTTAGMLGKFVVADIFQITMLGSIIFMIFMYTGTLFLINIFVMIVMYEFEQVRNDSSRQTNQYEIIDHIQTKVLRSIGMYGRENVPACYVRDSMKDYELLTTLTAKADLLLHRVLRWRINYDNDDDDIVLPPRRAQDMPDPLYL